MVGLGYEIWITYLHTLALVYAEDIEAMTFAPFVTESFPPTVEFLTAMARAVDDGDYPPDLGPLRTHAALVDDLIQARLARGVDAERLQHVKALVDRRVAEGHGGDGFACLFETIKESSS